MLTLLSALAKRGSAGRGDALNPEVSRPLEGAAERGGSSDTRQEGLRPQSNTLPQRINFGAGGKDVVSKASPLSFVGPGQENK